MVMLVVMKGHPGCGKSTIARALGARLKCPVIDKDDIRDCSFHLQQALSTTPAPVAAAAILNDFSYDVMWRITQTQLQLGISVIVDCPLSRPRLFLHARSLASQYDAHLVVLECVPSNPLVWKWRLEARSAVPGIPPPSCGSTSSEACQCSIDDKAPPASCRVGGRSGHHVGDRSEVASSGFGQHENLAEFPEDLLRNPKNCLRYYDPLQSSQSHGLRREACQYSVDRASPSSRDGCSSHISNRSGEASGYGRRKTLAENPEDLQRNPEQCPCSASADSHELCTEACQCSVGKALLSSGDGRSSQISDHSEGASGYGRRKTLAENPEDLQRNPEKFLHSDILQFAQSHGLCRETCQYFVDNAPPSSRDGRSSLISDHSKEASGYGQRKALAENPAELQRKPEKPLHSDLLQSARSHGLRTESCQYPVKEAPPSNEDGRFSHISDHPGEASGYGRQKTPAEHPEDLLRNPKKCLHSPLPQSARSHGLCRERFQYSVNKALPSSGDGHSSQISDHSEEASGYGRRKTLAEHPEDLPGNPEKRLHCHLLQSAQSHGLCGESCQISVELGAPSSGEDGHSSHISDHSGGTAGYGRRKTLAESSGDRGLHREAHRSQAEGAQLSEENTYSGDGSDVSEVSCTPRGRELPMAQGWHKPSSWEGLQELIAGYKGCYEYETPGARKLVVDTTCSSTTHSQDDILDWILLRLRDLDAA